MKITLFVLAMLLSKGLGLDNAFGKQPEEDAHAIEGRWVCTLFQRSGVVDETYQKPVVVRGQEVLFQTDNGPDKASIVLDASKIPKQLRWTHESEVLDHPVMCEFRGIYLLSGDTLLICVSDGTTDPAPGNFESSKSNGHLLMILTRERKAGKGQKSGRQKEKGVRTI